MYTVQGFPLDILIEVPCRPLFIAVFIIVSSHPRLLMKFCFFESFRLNEFTTQLYTTLSAFVKLGFEDTKTGLNFSPVSFAFS